MRVAPDAVRFLADDQAELAVGLQVDEAVDDVHAGGFQPGRPRDVVALVESRLQLDEHRDLLAGLRRLVSRSTSGESCADAVERHLDRDDVRVVDGGLAGTSRPT